MHASGQLGAAETLYRDIISVEPNHTGALHYLGVLAHQKDRQEEASAFIEAALRAAPDDPGALINLANVRRAQGKLVEAAVHARVALALRPDLVEAHLTLAAILSAAGHATGALAHCRRALELRPGETNALLAAPHALIGLEQSTGFVDGYDPARVEYGIASELAHRGRRFDALSHYEAAIHLNPDEPQFHIGLGTIHHDWDDLEKALACFERAVTLDPASAQARCNLGITLHELGQHHEALAAFDEAERHAPDHVLVHWNKALALLMLGRWNEGWKEHEWRWRLPGKQAFPHAAWDGSSLDGRTILVHSEQGLGDALQFLRYLPLVKASGGRVLFLCPPALHRLVRDFPGIDQLLENGPVPPFDVQAPLIGMPRLFGTTPDSIPPAIAFRGIPADGTAGARIRAAPGVKVGLVWAGNPSHPNDARRSCPLSAFNPLLDVAGCSFFSLQRGTGEEALAQTGLIEKIFPLGDLLTDLAETAAAVAALDLIITVDTALAHLAGSMGRPAWLLLPHVADWRWLADRDDTPWYPSARLFRQPRRGDWLGLMETVGAALVQHAAPGRLAECNEVGLQALTRNAATRTTANSPGGT